MINAGITHFKQHTACSHRLQKGRPTATILRVYELIIDQHQSLEYSSIKVPVLLLVLIFGSEFMGWSSMLSTRAVALFCCTCSGQIRPVSFFCLSLSLSDSLSSLFSTTPSPLSLSHSLNLFPLFSSVCSLLHIFTHSLTVSVSLSLKSSSFPFQ